MTRPPRLTINLDKNERRILERLAAEAERSVAGEARIAIRQYIEKRRAAAEAQQ